MANTYPGCVAQDEADMATILLAYSEQDLNFCVQVFGAKISKCTTKTEVLKLGSHRNQLFD